VVDYGPHGIRSIHDQVQQDLLQFMRVDLQKGNAVLHMSAFDPKRTSADRGLKAFLPRLGVEGD